MAYFKRTNGYSVSLAEEALSNELVKLVGKQLEIQYEFEKTGEVVNGKEKMKRTDNIQAYQVYVATDNHNPFKIKFLPDDKPDLSKHLILRSQVMILAFFTSQIFLLVIL